MDGVFHLPSLVMNEMNSLTHSCMHSLASLAIFAFSGKAIFMIRATGAKLRMLASEVRSSFLDGRFGSDGEGNGEGEDMVGQTNAASQSVVPDHVCESDSAELCAAWANGEGNSG